MKKVRVQKRDKATSVTDSKWWSILKKRATEFCSATGLHGYKYISQSQRPMVERIVWAIIVFTALGCSLVVMNLTWNYYANHPTLTVIESTHHGIWNYPFPAVTVCNLNRMSYELTKEFVDNIKIPANLSKEFIIKEMRIMLELVMPGIYGSDLTKNLSRLQDILDDNNLSIMEVVDLVRTARRRYNAIKSLTMKMIRENDVTKNCSTLLKSCKWKGILDECEKYFTQIMARDGLCCSFNFYPFPGIIQPDKLERIAACGYETGLTIIVNPEPNDYHAAIIGSYGIKILIHYALDYPDLNAGIQLVRLNNQHFISVSPAEMYSKPLVRSLTIPMRKCIFSDEADKVIYGNSKERNLTYAIYTYHNCIAECRATVVKEKCGCIPYYMPQNGTRICNLRDVDCLKEYRPFYDTSWPGMNLSFQNLQEPPNLDDPPCGCIPDCTLFNYPIQSSYGIVDSTIYYGSGSFSKNPSSGVSIFNHSIVHVFFNDLVAFQYRRSVNFNWRNLFATFGGLFGLLAGFSLMSIMEFLYFLVIGVINDVYNSIKRSNEK